MTWYGSQFWQLPATFKTERNWNGTDMLLPKHSRRLLNGQLGQPMVMHAYGHSPKSSNELFPILIDLHAGARPGSWLSFFYWFLLLMKQACASFAESARGQQIILKLASWPAMGPFGTVTFWLKCFYFGDSNKAVLRTMGQAFGMFKRIWSSRTRVGILSFFRSTSCSPVVLFGPRYSWSLVCCKAFGLSNVNRGALIKHRRASVTELSVSSSTLWLHQTTKVIVCASPSCRY